LRTTTALKGKVKIGDSSEIYDAYNTLVLSTDEKQDGVAVEAVDGPAELVLVIVSFQINYDLI